LCTGLEADKSGLNTVVVGFTQLLLEGGEGRSMARIAVGWVLGDEMKSTKVEKGARITTGRAFCSNVRLLWSCRSWQ